MIKIIKISMDCTGKILHGEFTIETYIVIYVLIWVITCFICNLEHICLDQLFDKFTDINF